MNEIDTVPADIVLFLEDEMILTHDEYEKNADRFAFVDWNVMKEVATHLRMLSANHSTGHIHIHEENWFVFIVGDSP